MVTFESGDVPNKPYPLEILPSTGDLVFEAIEGADWLGLYTFHLTVTAFAGVF